VIKNWFNNGEKATISGKIEILQQSKYDFANIAVSLEGLVQATGYQIHMVCNL